MNTAPTPQVAPCPLRQFLNNHAPVSLDWPCDCGGPSSACTKDKDGNCG